MKFVLIVFSTQAGFDILYVQFFLRSLQKSAILWFVDIQWMSASHHINFRPRVSSLQKETVSRGGMFKDTLACGSL